MMFVTPNDYSEFSLGLGQANFGGPSGMGPPGGGPSGMGPPGGGPSSGGPSSGGPQGGGPSMIGPSGGGHSRERHSDEQNLWLGYNDPFTGNDTPRPILPDAFRSAMAKIDHRLATNDINRSRNLFYETGSMNRDFTLLEKKAIVGSKNYYFYKTSLHTTSEQFPTSRYAMIKNEMFIYNSNFRLKDLGSRQHDGSLLIVSSNRGNEGMYRSYPNSLRRLTETRHELEVGRERFVEILINRRNNNNR
jgi:hypothetical protein